MECRLKFLKDFVNFSLLNPPLWKFESSKRINKFSSCMRFPKWAHLSNKTK